SPILLLYSFSTIRCPPHTSTLSPYTTLFRSKIRNVKYPSHRLFMRDARLPFLFVNGIRFSGIVLSDPTVNFVPERDLPETDRQVYTGIFAGLCFMTPRDDFDPLSPQREAAFFYGLFLRGHSVETLRQD